MLHVLIADDEAIERRYLSSLFQKHPEQFEVSGEARNGQETIELATCLKPDIIIMDINMPLMNGLESAHKIKQLLPDTFILLNTAYAEFDFAKKALDYNLDAYLLKPASESQILEAIENCLTNRRKRPETIPEESPADSVDAISTVVNYISANYCNPLALQELAALVHFSPSYLSKLFHQTKGITIRAYVNQIRLEHAVKLLKSTDSPIQEIASNCGFSNVSHFNRVFKQQTGNSPLEYRHLCR